MSKTVTIVVVILTLGIALAYWKREWILSRMGLNRPPEIQEQNNNSDQNYSPGITYRECTTGPFKKGCKGKNIETIQKALNHIHNAGLKVDGYFGENTEKALVENGYGETVEMEDIRKMQELLKS